MPSAISILNDTNRDETAAFAARFDAERVLERLHHVMQLDVSALQRESDPLARFGVETDTTGAIVKSGYGLFQIATQAIDDLEWPPNLEVDRLYESIRRAHGKPVRFLIWAGMGGSIEDKLAYQAGGLLRGGPRFYALDSTDPAKLKAILEDIHEQSQLPTKELLEAALIIAMAMGMTSYEPVLNLEKLVFLYEQNKVDPTPHIVCMTIPGSLLDRFAEERNLARVPLQSDGGNTTAGRHSAPLTNGSLYPLALARADLRAWIAGTQIETEDTSKAWKLAAFLHAQGTAGRDQVTLLLPESWRGAAMWTKQNFEESLGKSEQIGIKIIIDERLKARFYRKSGDPQQRRCFLAVQLRGEPHPDADALTQLRHLRYPLAIVTFPSKVPLSSWMQWVHYVVFGLAYLREMNFVTQPSVELYKSIAAEIYQSGSQEAWDAVAAEQTRWTPERYSATLNTALQNGAEYAELTFFGDMRYSENGKRMRKRLHAIADRFRSSLKIPVDVGEGPAMNHSYHEMIIGHGRCFSTLIASKQQARFPGARYEPDYHKAQFAATKRALEQRGRAVVPLLIRNLEEDSLDGLDAFFRQALSRLPQHG